MCSNTRMAVLTYAYKIEKHTSGKPKMDKDINKPNTCAMHSNIERMFPNMQKHKENKQNK